MTTTDINTEQLIIWLSHQEDIPLETRIDMLAHWEKINHFDQKSLDFLRKYMNHRQQLQLKRIQALTDELAANSVLPEKSYINGKLEAELTNLVDSFSEGFKAFETKTNQAEENTEHQTELNQVAALKASVGA